jgi:hypothetical protein
LSQARARRGIKSTPFAPEISTLAQFIEPRRAMALSAELTRFHEAEERETTQVFGHVAQRFSAYVGHNEGCGIQGPRHDLHAVRAHARRLEDERDGLGRRAPRPGHGIAVRKLERAAAGGRMKRRRDARVQTSRRGTV